MKKLPIIAASLAVLLAGAVTAQDRDSQQHDMAHGAQKWSRGKSIPNHYLSSKYAVGDWRKLNLRDPGDDGRWVRDEDGNYILVSVGTRTIEDVVTADVHP